MHWHEDIFALPQGATRLATSENTPNQAFRFGARAYGLQYHIELTPHIFDIWLQYPDYKKAIAQAMGYDAAEMTEQVRPECYSIYREHSRRMFENFLKIGECL
ncbi:MAG: hypothetical protein NVS4B7_18910 [Ktedonobacteraceae bacterium]